MASKVFGQYVHLYDAHHYASPACRPATASSRRMIGKITRATEPCTRHPRSSRERGLMDAAAYEAHCASEKH